MKATFKQGDPVPKEQLVNSVDLPFCGVSKETRERIEVAGALSTSGGGCTWTDDIANKFRFAHIELFKANDHGEAMAQLIGEVKAENESSFVNLDGTHVAPRRVSGLGDEAFVRQMKGPDQTYGAVAYFRTRNVVANVRYAWENSTPGSDDRERYEKQVLHAVFDLAQDVAGSLGAPSDARPAIAPAEREVPPLRPVPKACDIVEPDTTHQPIPDTNHDLSVAPYNAAEEDACMWITGSHGTLRVEVASFTRTPEAPLHTGVRMATRKYRVMHQRHRRSTPQAPGYRNFPLTYSENIFFRALDDLGEEAYITYGENDDGVGDARVLFRVRNVLVEIDWESREEAREDLLNRVYPLARQAARNLTR